MKVLSGIRGGIYYGWWILLILCVSHLINSGSYMHGFTAFFNPILEEFGWTYTIVSLAVSFRGLESGIVSPLAGICVDRYGTRATMVFGTAVMGLGFLFFSHVSNMATFYIAAVVIAIGSSFCSGVSTFAATARWFTQRRGLAMGILTAAWGAGGLLIPVLVALISQYTWRPVLNYIGIVTLIMVIPLAILLKNPSHKEYSPEKKNTDSKSAAGLTSDGLTTKETMKTREFWLFSGAILFSNLAGIAALSHLIPYLVSVGIPRETAGLMAIIYSVGNISGRFGLGWLGDIIGTKWCFVLCVLVQAVGMAIFATATNVVQFTPGLVLVGFGFGGMVPLRPVIQGEMFGLKAFGFVGGLLMALGTVGSIVAPVFAGWMYDVSGNYRPAWVVLTIATLVALPLIMMMKKKVTELPLEKEAG